MGEAAVGEAVVGAAVVAVAVVAVVGVEVTARSRCELLRRHPSSCDSCA